MIAKICENCDFFDGIGYCYCKELEMYFDDSCGCWKCSAFDFVDKDGYPIE